MKKTLIIILTLILILSYSCNIKTDTIEETTGQTQTESETGSKTTQVTEPQMIDKVRSNRNYVLLDRCDSLQSSMWNMSGVSSEIVITDSEGEVTGLTVPNGNYGFYSVKETGTYASIEKKIEIGDGPWILELQMNIKNLITPSANHEWRGFIIDIFAGGKRYYFAVNGEGNVYAQQGNSNTQKPLKIDGIKYAGYCNWQFIYNGVSKVYLLVDERVVGYFDGVWSIAEDKESGISLRNVPINVLSGANEVYIDHIGLSFDEIPDWIESDPKITYINSMPSSNSTDIILTVRVDNVSNDLLNNGKASLNVILESDGNTVSESEVMLTGKNTYILMNGQNTAGIIDLKADLSINGSVLHQYSRKLNLHATVNMITDTEQITSTNDNIYVFNALDKIPDFEESGWKKIIYRYTGNTEEYIGLDSTPSSGVLEIPVEPVGWFSVYIGYLKGTQGISVDLGNGFTDIDIEKTIFLPKDQTGDSILKEAFLGAVNFSGQKISIKGFTPKKARIAYIKFVSMTDHDIAVYNEAPDNVKRAIYNNDGYSDFYSGYYPTEADLLQRAVNSFKDRDVETVYFCLGTTFALNYDSKFAGSPFSNITPDMEANLMRDGDKTVVHQIKNFAYEGIIPVQSVALRADELGIKTYASLRMNAFYDPNTYPWLNGSIYDDYSQYRITDSNGKYKNNISYASQEVRELVTNILVEAASFDGVDGVNLDFCRYPDCLGYERELVDPFIEEYGFDPTDLINEDQLSLWYKYKTNVFNEFMRNLREKIPNKEISVRIPETGWYEYGFDLTTWIENGYIDILIPSAVGYENFYDIKPFIEMTKAGNVLVYAGINKYLSGHDMTKKEEDMIKAGLKVDLGHTYLSTTQYLERARYLYSEGCAGIHLFNNWSPDNGILGMIGDKQYVEKWYTFSYPAVSVYEFITVDSVS